MHEPELPRQLGVVDTVAIYVGIIIGSGIFVAPSAVARVAPGWGGLGLWIAAGMVAALGALVYAECGARLPRPGGFYVVYREALGSKVAFIGGWAALAVTYPASIAAIAHVHAAYLAGIFPWLEGRETGVAVGAVGLGGMLSLAGVRSGPLAQRVLTAIKVSALLLLSVAAMASRPESTTVSQVVGGPSLPAVIGAWMILQWTYDGWSNVSLVAGEVREPGRTLPRAVVIGTVLLVSLYGCVQLAVMHALGQEALTSKRVFADAVSAGLGPAAGRGVGVLVVVSTFGSLAGSLFAGARVGFAMARDRLLPVALGEVHATRGTPAWSILCLTAATLGYTVLGGFDDLLTVFSFSVWIFYGLSAVCLLVLRRRGVGGAQAFHAPGGALAPLGLIAAALVMAVGVALDDPLHATMGVAALAAGIPLHALWQRVHGPNVSLRQRPRQ